MECKQCGREFSTKRESALFCSHECHKESLRRFSVSKEELRELVWKMPMTKIAKLFGVTDKAISKRCKKFGIEKPGRGYWTKKNKRV